MPESIGAEFKETLKAMSDLALTMRDGQKSHDEMVLGAFEALSSIPFNLLPQKYLPMIPQIKDAINLNVKAIKEHDERVLHGLLTISNALKYMAEKTSE